MAEYLSFNKNASKAEKYLELIPQLKALTGGENNRIANMANICAALKETFGFFWVGFYLIKGNELILGPFQGSVACTRITKGKGVCGSSWERSETIIVDDVDQFPGHIACSSLSKSEIVVPIWHNNSIIGVLDVDSDRLADFDSTDKLFLEKILNEINLGDE
jgi:GAF domain-containing protein